jgi:hypothetical protein
VNVPKTTMRQMAYSGSEVVSEAYFSEEVKVLEFSEKWLKIETADHYSGWVKRKALIKRVFPYETDAKTSRLSTHLFPTASVNLGPVHTVPYGSRFKILEQISEGWLKVLLPDDQELFVQAGNLAAEPLMESKEDLVEFSKKFLGLPYTWGGRTSFGYDCSGFVQMLYRQIGVDLLRDSSMQISDERFQTISKDQLEPGDLIFFGTATTTEHVAMYLGEDQFIHATTSENQPWIRISSLDSFEWSAHESANYSYREFKQLL